MSRPIPTIVAVESVPMRRDTYENLRNQVLRFMGAKDPRQNWTPEDETRYQLSLSQPTRQRRACP